MRLIISKSIQYEEPTPDAKFCNQCTFLNPEASKQCYCFNRKLKKGKTDKSYRRCKDCLFHEMKPINKELL
jgi:hypothetical protein